MTIPETYNKLEKTAIKSNGIFDYDKLFKFGLGSKETVAEHFSLNPEPVCVRGLLGEIEKQLTQTTSEKNIKLNTNVHKHFPELIEFDKELLQNILSKLITNTGKLYSCSSVHIDAELTYGMGNNLVDLRFTIIANEIKSENPDVRSGFRNKYDSDGNRIEDTIIFELNSIRQLISRFGGTLTSERIPDGKWVFTIDFKKIKTLEIEINDACFDEFLYEYKSADILIIDELGKNREFIKSCLAAQNFNIQEARDIEEVKTLSKIYDFDLVFMRIESQLKDSLENAKILKNSFLLPKTNFIAITPSSVESDELKNEEIFDDFLTYPLDSCELMNCISKFLEYSEYLSDMDITELLDSDVNMLIAKNLVESIDNRKLSKFLNDYDKFHKRNISSILDITDFNSVENILNDFVKLADNSGIEAFSDLIGHISTASENFDTDTIYESVKTITNSINYCKRLMLYNAQRIA